MSVTLDIKQVIDVKQVEEAIAKKRLENLNLSYVDLNGFDFSGCYMSNVVFASKEQEGRVLKNVRFCGAELRNVFFDHAELYGCDFDGVSSLMRVSFKKARLYKCRFRRTRFEWCDFRYTEIESATFESSYFEFCDFYRSFFLGICIFRKSLLSRSSLYYAYFDQGANLRRENLAGGVILQQDKGDYKQFLIDWPNNGPSVRENDQGRESDWDPNDSLKNRFLDAEDIYKTLNGLWSSKGFLGDANWAYVRGKRMERKRLIADVIQGKSGGIFAFAKNLLSILGNFISDACFGYGESIARTVLTYVFVIFIFSYFYYSSAFVNVKEYVVALMISVKNMVAQPSQEIQGVSPLLDFLCILQTTIGILITGIFGFILGNKIRNQ